LCSWRRFRQGPQGDGLLLTLAWPGEYFGELALFNGAPRSAAATALDDCRLLFLPRDAFRAFLQAHPAALWTCLEVIVGQLRRLTAVADDLTCARVWRAACCGWRTRGRSQAQGAHQGAARRR
jgi:CRP-like cAMP-binding protein